MKNNQNNRGVNASRVVPGSMKRKLKTNTGGKMKRFLFLAFMLFTLVAFTANAPPCDMGMKTFNECSIDVGHADNTITGFPQVVYVFCDVGRTATIEIAQEIYPIYPMQPGNIKASLADQRGNYRDVDCTSDVLLPITISSTTLQSDPMLLSYTQIGYSIWN